MKEPMAHRSFVVLVVFSLLVWPAPAIAEPPVPPAIEGRPSDDVGTGLHRNDPDEEEDDDQRTPPSDLHFHVGGGIAPLVWMPANNPLSVRFELEFRWTPAPPWSLIADVSYIQIGEAGSTLAEDGIDLWVGGMREWAVGGADDARWFPHARAGLVFEATSTRRASSAKFIALRAGPGIDWNFASTVRLNLDLELGLGLLAIKAGSEGDSALFELTLGLALRILWGF